MDPEGERQIPAYVKETYGHDFVFLTDYPSRIRPFYHMRHDDDRSSPRATTCIYNGARSPRAPSASTASTSCRAGQQKGLEPEELECYLDFFRYGAPPHGGFGMGLARVLMLMPDETSSAR